MDELISKRAVIEAIEKARANVGHNLERSIGKSIIEILDDVGRDVDRLPPALGTNLAEVGTDCISRQQAIDDIWTVSPLARLDRKWIDRWLRQLPPAQPEIIRCKDCKHRDPEDKKCDCGHDIEWQLPRDDYWYCADGERKEDG